MAILITTTVNRLIQYRKILEDMQYNGVKFIFSHELAALVGCSSAQIRRDFMDIGYSGTPMNGYNISDLKEKICSILDNEGGESIAVIGVGKLGRILLEHCYWHFHNLASLSGFDIDETKVGQKIFDSNIYHVTQMSEIIKRDKIKIAIITVPAESVKDVARKAILAGVRGILNYTPIILEMPPQVYVANMDMNLSLEKVSFYTRMRNELIDD